jgi:serine/threonine protein kinase
MTNGIIMLEFFDGSDLAKYTNYPINESTFLTHRLLPRSGPGEANFSTLGKYLGELTPEGNIFKLFDEIYTGIVCLHGAGILHKDFELKNILIRSDGKIGISDFGVSRIIGKEYISYGFFPLFDAFKSDLNSLGPMMGNFLDSTNQEPYQYRLERGTVDDISILNNIKDRMLKDAFLLLTSFKDLATFVSFIYFFNQHLDRDTGKQILDQAAEFYNDNIIHDVSDESEQEVLFVYDNTIESVIDIIYDRLLPEARLSDLILYFRLVISKMLKLSGIGETLDTESVHDYILQNFGHNYTEVITSMATQLRYGFLLNNFDLFYEIYQKDI